MNHTIKKSYVLIDTPVSCARCDLASVVGNDYMTMECPLLKTTFSINSYDDDWKNADCPLKTIEINVKMDI